MYIVYVATHNDTSNKGTTKKAYNGVFIAVEHLQRGGEGEGGTATAQPSEHC